MVYVVLGNKPPSTAVLVSAPDTVRVPLCEGLVELYSTIQPVISPLRSSHGTSPHCTVMLVKFLLTFTSRLDGLPVGAVEYTQHDIVPIYIIMSLHMAL